MADASRDRAVQAAAVDFLGVCFDLLKMEQVLDLLRRAAPADPFRFVVTPNVDHMVKLADPELAVPELRDAYGAAWLRLCDSRTLLTLARLSGVGLTLVPGSDLTARLFREVIEPGDRIAIVGSDEESLRLLRARFPGVEFVQHVPPMGLRRNPEAIARAAGFIRDAHARFTFLAVGAPQQEMVAMAVARAGGATGIGLCVGASIDFVSGTVKRAPLVLQRLGLEWTHRLAGDPRRMWRRYLVEGPRIFLLAAQWRRRSNPG